MRRFHDIMGDGMVEIQVTSEHVQPPRLDVLRGGAAKAAPHPARRPTRQVLGRGPPAAASTSELEACLRSQLQGMKTLMKSPCDTAGVRGYLRFCDHMGWPQGYILPNPARMEENLMLYAIDAGRKRGMLGRHLLTSLDQFLTDHQPIVDFDIFFGRI